MNSRIPRRQFIQTAGLGALGGAGLALSENRAEGQSPATTDQKPRLLVGCCAYSFLKYLEAGKMTMEEFILKGVELGVNALDMTTYWLKSTDTDYLLSLRHLAFKNGMPFSGAACGPDMLQADKDRRREVLEEIKAWVDRTDVLGASHLRVFAGRLPQGAAAAQGLDWTVECMKAACDYAAKKGITLGVETHSGITQKADTTLELIRRVDSPYAGITLDITHFVGDSDEDKYKQIEACIPYANQTHIRDHFDNHDPLDLDRVWQMFAKAGYKGYMSLEYQGREDVMTAAPKLVEQMKGLSRKYSSV
jgi:sugar phosphate isomerase/epimerase